MTANTAKLGVGISGMGLGLFGIPAAMASAGQPLPKVVTVICMFTGLLLVPVGHFVTTSFATAVDEQQQKQINALGQVVQSHTDRMPNPDHDTELLAKVNLPISPGSKPGPSQPLQPS